MTLCIARMMSAVVLMVIPRFILLNICVSFGFFRWRLGCLVRKGPSLSFSPSRYGLRIANKDLDPG